MSENTQRVYTLNEIFNLQDELNEAVKSNWKETLTPSHYLVAAMTELSEMLDEGKVGFKFWKGSTNIQPEKVKMEFIDSVHFIFSAIMMAGAYREEDLECTIDQFNRFDDEEHIIDRDGMLNHQFFMDFIESLMGPDGFSGSRIFSYLNKIMQDIDISVEEFSVTYAVKSELNHIRQQKGYGEGKYDKDNHKGREDNEILYDVIREFMNNPSMNLQDAKDMVQKEFE